MSTMLSPTLGKGCDIGGSPPVEHSLRPHLVLRPIRAELRRLDGVARFLTAMTPSGAIRLWINPDGIDHCGRRVTLWVLLSLKSVLRGVAQLVEHRSPKPAVGGSSPSAPADSDLRGAALSIHHRAINNPQPVEPTDPETKLTSSSPFIKECQTCR